MNPNPLPLNATDEAFDKALVPKATFLRELENALAERRGFAAGKIGYTEFHLLLLLMALRQNAPRAQIRMLELWLRTYAVQDAGLFPAALDFYDRFAQVYLQAVRELDIVGWMLKFDKNRQREMLNFFQITNSLTDFHNLHPDQAIPDDPTNCYLPLLRGKKILIVNPFGNLLAARATREIFEGVWRVSGKKFFAPASVEGLEFPYGFARETWARYPTALDLMDEIESRIAQRDFDVALVGAGGMGIPLTACVKRLGKVGILLGGHLQVLFGVKGRRWKNTPRWRDVYFNEWWIDMPEEYRPKEGDVVGENAYW